MYIHPKTLLFRKNRIEQLLGVTLDDGGVRMNLSLALQLYGLRYGAASASPQPAE